MLPSISIGVSTFQFAFMSGHSLPSNLLSLGFNSGFSKSLISYGYFPADFFSVGMTVDVVDDALADGLTDGDAFTSGVDTGFCSPELLAFFWLKRFEILQPSTKERQAITKTKFFKDFIFMYLCSQTLFVFVDQFVNLF